jgi:hypothetical protein
MRVMVIVKATKDSEAGKLLSQQLVAAISHAEDEVAGQPQVLAYRLPWGTSSVHSVPNQRGPALGRRPGTPRQARRRTSLNWTCL